MQSLLSFLRGRIATRKAKQPASQKGFFSRLLGRGIKTAGKTPIQIQIPTPISSTRHIDEFTAEIDHKIEIGIQTRDEITARNYGQLQKHLAGKGRISSEEAENKFQEYTQKDDSERGQMWTSDKEEYSEEFDEWDLH